VVDYQYVVCILCNMAKVKAKQTKPTGRRIIFYLHEEDENRLHELYDFIVSKKFRRVSYSGVVKAVLRSVKADSHLIEGYESAMGSDARFKK